VLFREHCFSMCISGVPCPKVSLAFQRSRSAGTGTGTGKGGQLGASHCRQHGKALASMHLYNDDGVFEYRAAHAHAPSSPALYTTNADRHEGQKRKTARSVELTRSTVVSPSPFVTGQANP